MEIQKYNWVDLARRLREAYVEECRTGECRCISIEEHERMLRGGR